MGSLTSEVTVEIRSVTCFVEQSWPLDKGLLARVGALGLAARESFSRAGVPVQTVRLATQPFPEVLTGHPPETALTLATSLQAACSARSLDYCSIGSVLPQRPGVEMAPWIDVIPRCIQATERVFASVQVATREAGIVPEAVERAAGAISRIAAETDLGFGNLRFAALANCPPGIPFFPVAYHGGGPPAFAIATESADLAVAAFTGADNWDMARDRLIEAIESYALRIATVAEQLAAEHGMRFAGVDFSLAPFPEVGRSIAEAIERLTGGHFGEQGTLFAVATLTDCLRSAHFHRCGFSEVMLPVLEDAVLARRSVERAYTLDSLLLYSAVCGTGLDTIPLPGDMDEAQLSAILLDVASLAVALDKPLTARLMPVPGKVAGDPVDFGFSYFAPARILRPLSALGPNVIGRMARCHPFSSQERTPA
jgi:uncharacterized protein (UPF0210 family)